MAIQEPGRLRSLGDLLRKRRRVLPTSASRAADPDAAAARRVAYEAIVRENAAALLSVARRMCAGGEDRAQDLVQEAVVRGYEAYAQGRFEDGSNARAWLLRIMTNHFINDAKRRSRWEAGVTVEALAADGAVLPGAMHAAPADRPEAALLAGTLDEPLEQALAELPEDLRVCVVLVDIEGLGYAETAAALGVPIGTVRSRLSRARLRLHALLYDYAKDRRRS